MAYGLKASGCDPLLSSEPLQIKALKWPKDHACSINISQDMADIVSGIFIFLLHYTS